MARQNQIGVVTVTYNSGSVLSDFLRCMLGQTHERFILFAVDNASIDNTLQILQECSDSRLTVIANPGNDGVAKGNNQGIKAALQAGCDSVLLLNNDTEFDAGLLSQLDVDSDSYLADMVCPKVLYFDEPSRIWAAGGEFQPWLGYRSIHTALDEIDTDKHDEARLVTYTPTCCVLIRKAVFETIGLMDERYFVYVDDVDFMYRALKAGIKLRYLPTARLLHKVGRLTGGLESPFTIRYCTRNRVYFLLKSFGIIRSLHILLLYQIHFMIEFCRRRLSFSSLCLRERAVLEGFSLWRESLRIEVDLSQL